MNLRLFFKIFIYSLTMLCLTSALVFSTVKKDNIPPTPNTSSNNTQDAITQKEVPESSTLSHYMLKLEENTVNIYEVYSDQTKIRCGTLDIPISTLREIDKINFEHGIIVENESEILHITEDFTS